MIAKLLKLFLMVLMIPFLLRNSITELKGREPDAPRLEAPLSARHQRAPSRARLGADSARSSDKKLAVFQSDRSQSHANLVLDFVFYIRSGTSCVTVRVLRPSPEIAKNYFICPMRPVA
jgi:hypothetical protein